ncbi:MAG: MFS transporter, partial [Sciscionella sp.]
MSRESLLSHRDFRRLWTGDAISQLGSSVTMVAMPLLAVTMLRATPLQVGLLTTFEFLAFPVLGLPAGALVDRMRRRRVMIAADLGRAATLGSVPVAAVLGVLTLWQLFVVVFVTGCLTVFFDVSYQSYLPFLVGRDHLVDGNAKLQGTQSVAQVAGPSVGGLLVQLVTAPFALATDAVSYLCSALWLSTIRRAEPTPEPHANAHLLTQIREGVTFVFRHPLLRPIAACTATSNLWTSAAQSMLIVLLARELRLSAGVIGALMSAGACGGVLGAFLARRLAARLG